MHRWFRFCAVIALMAFSRYAIAQSTSKPNSGDAASDGDIPTSKHALKPTPTQIVQHHLEQQGKRIDQLVTEIQAQTKQMEELAKRAELQSKQIETLNADLNRLTTVVLAHSGELAAAAAAPSPKTSSGEPAVTTGSGATGVTIHKADPVPAEPAPTLAPDGSPTHVIKRGENLISVARQHGTTVAELLKINKIEDERKLQIGQTLLLPKPSSQKTDPQ